MTDKTKPNLMPFARRITSIDLEDWQNGLPIGSEVLYIDDAKSIWLTKTRSEPWRLDAGQWVVLLEGRTGGYDLGRVSKVVKP